MSSRLATSLPPLLLLWPLLPPPPLPLLPPPSSLVAPLLLPPPLCHAATASYHCCCHLRCFRRGPADMPNQWRVGNLANASAQPLPSLFFGWQTAVAAMACGQSCKCKRPAIAVSPPPNQSWREVKRGMRATLQMQGPSRHTTHRLPAEKFAQGFPRGASPCLLYFVFLCCQGIKSWTAVFTNTCRPADGGSNNKVRSAKAEDRAEKCLFAIIC